MRSGEREGIPVGEWLPDSCLFQTGCSGYDETFNTCNMAVFMLFRPIAMP